jgi:flagellar secretion chaperone FliS
MSQPNRSQYLESKVLTAPSHRLHLMLIEGAIRFGKEAEVALRRGDAVAADAPSMRLIDVIGELLVGVRQTKTELNQKLAELYLYLFRLAGEAKVNDDPDKLVEVLKLLEFERQTWQLVCDKLGNDPPVAAAPTRGPVATPIKSAALPSMGISLEA